MSSPVTKHTSIFSSASPSTKPPLCTFLFLIILCILAFYTLHHPSSDPTNAVSVRNPQTTLRYRSLFLSSSSNSTIASYLRSLTLHPHLAGTKRSLPTARYVYSHFQSLRLETHMLNYSSLLSYPIRSSLSAHFSNGSSFPFSLTENVPDDDVVQAYHAYSPSGSVSHAEVVFVNYGREDDYHALEVLGVKVKGCVVLVRKGGGLSRGGVVRIAESKGALAVLLYAERGKLRGGGRGGVERGTVMRGVGDPLSPGWGGVAGGERLGLNNSEVLKRFPKIPSLPLSFENADVILRSLGGPAADWSAYSGRVGPGPTRVNFTYQVCGWYVCFLFVWFVR